jgi:Uma2 family endonuclease
MVEPQTNLLTDRWVPASWEEYLRTIADPTYEKAKGYYYQGHMRIETASVGRDHAADHTIIILAVGLFGIVKGISLHGFDNCSFRKAGVQEFQPDVSYYVGERAQSVPPGT